MNGKYRLFIAEDHHLLRCGLRSALSNLVEYDVVGEATDGKEACEQVGALMPDLLITGLSMPGMSAIDVVAAVKRRYPLIRHVVLSAHKTEEHVREALRAGVDGYVLRDAPFDELIAALRSAVRGKLYLSADLFGNLVQSLVNDRDTCAPKSKWELLTARERVVLKLVAEGRTNRQVGQYLNLSHKTIEKYRANAMRKLQVGTLPDLVLAAIDMGLIVPTTGRPRAFNQGAQATLLPFDSETTRAPLSTSNALSIAEYRSKVVHGT